MTDSNPLLEAALSYAKRGFLVFPIRARTKVPHSDIVGGFYAATASEAKIRQWWTQSHVGSNIGIRTGECSNLLVLDVDTKPGITADELVADKKTPATPTVRTGGNGLQFFFAYPKGHSFTISAGKLGPGFDTRGNSGYVVVPPSIHPNGQPYKWFDCEDDEPAICPQWIVDGLSAVTVKPGAGQPGALIAKGQRHGALMSEAGSMRNRGAGGKEIYLRLITMRDERMEDPSSVSDDEVRKIAGWMENKEVGVATPENIAHGDEVAKGIDVKNNEDAVEYDASDVPEDVGEFPAHLLNVPGTINRWCKAIDVVSSHRQPLLAMACSIAAFGALIGRKVRTETNSRTSLYCVGLAGTGAGKDKARQFIKNLFIAAGAMDKLPGENIASDAALEAHAKRVPASLYLLDEFGGMLSNWTRGNSESYESSIIDILMKLFSYTGDTYIGKIYADPQKRPTVYINQPNVCLYCTSTPPAFYNALSSQHVSNGLVNRLLVFRSDCDMPEPRDFIHQPPPKELVDEIKAWEEMPYGPGNVSDENPDPKVVYSTEAAKSVFKATQDMTRKELINKKNQSSELWARVIDKAWRLALIAACSKSRENPLIDEPEARWACDLCVFLTRQIEVHIHYNLAENNIERELKKVLRAIQSTGESGITTSEIHRKCRHLKGSEIKDIIAKLIGSDDVVLDSIETKGRPKVVYRLAKFRQKDQPKAMTGQAHAT